VPVYGHTPSRPKGLPDGREFTRALRADENLVGDAVYFPPMPRIAIAQLRPVKGEYAANLERLGGVLARVAELDPPVELLITPEASTSGYFVEGGVRDVAVTAGALVQELPSPHGAPGAGRAVGVRGGGLGRIHKRASSALPAP